MWPGSRETVSIHDLGADGRGVARCSNGRVVMVAGALPGDRVEAQLVRVPAKGAASGVVERLIEPSPDRVEHPCLHAAEGCPACPLGALRYERELAWKRKHLGQTLRRIGGLKDTQLGGIVYSPKRWRYRERLELHLVQDGKQWLFGYRARETVVPIRDCLLGSGELGRIIGKLSGSLDSLAAVAASSASEPMRLLIRENGRGEVVCVLFLLKYRSGDLPAMAGWLEAGGTGGWQIRKARSTASRFFNSKVLEESGTPWVHLPVDGRHVRAEPTVFVQANPDAAKLLVEEVLASFPADARLLDLYGGYGAFGLAHAVRGGSATVIDSSSEAVHAGKVFADESGLELSFHSLDLDRASPAEIPLEGHDVAILDPPRSGVGGNLAELLNRKGPHQIIYVSCHPAAFARDQKLLKNYRVLRVVPFDLFPATPELETMAVIERAG